MRVDIIKVRVLVEGVLVPDVSSVTVQSFGNEEARATIIFPSIPGFETEELKRARVLIFWSDVDIRGERSDDEWPLLFEGEIVGDSYQKTVASRHQVFHCLGYHTYWQQVLLYFYDVSTGAPNKSPWTQQLAVVLGNDTFTFDGQVAGANLRMRLVNEVISGAGDQYHSIVKRVFSDCLDTNHFFRTSNSDLKLDARFASPYDPNIDVLVGNTLLREAVEKEIMTVNGHVPMLDVLKSMLGVFRYQIINNPQPPLINDKNRKKKTAEDQDTQRQKTVADLTAYAQAPGNDAEPSDVAVTAVVEAIDGSATPEDVNNVGYELLRSAGVTDMDEGGDNHDFRLRVQTELGLYNSALAAIGNPENWDEEKGVVREPDDLLAQFLLMPDTRFALPPVCNIIYPSDQTQLSLDRQLLQEPTRGISEPMQDLGVNFEYYLAPPELGNLDGSGARVPERSIAPASYSGFWPPILPEASRVSSRFGPRQVKQRKQLPDGKVVWVDHPTASKFHRGMDFARPSGRVSRASFIGTPVYAFDDGVVVRSRVQTKGSKVVGYGQYIYVDHGNGLQTRYAHLSARRVTEGQRVSAGDLIGNVGNTGVGTGPHLHFEVRVNGEAVDPEPYYNQALESYRNPQSANSAEETSSVSTQGQELKTDLEQKGEKTFLDYKYLSPEEQLVGIVPFFDNMTLRAHTFMNFLGEGEQTQEYYRQMLNSSFLWRRYETRSLGALTMPFNPHPVAGFPGLVVDRVRSIIGLITSVTHTIAVDGGSGNATTTVQMEAPRYWDEGDPYYWVGGEEKYAPFPREIGGQKDRKLPDVDYARFPSYYLPSLVATNSLFKDEWWQEPSKPLKPRWRPIDNLYQTLLGCQAIPYGYASRGTSRGTTVAFNKAIDGRVETEDKWYEDRTRYTNTIVGEYYQKADANPILAAEHAKRVTRRLGVSERDLMSQVLRAETKDLGRSYSASAFRVDYQRLVTKMNKILSGERAFRG